MACLRRVIFGHIRRLRQAQIFNSTRLQNNSTASSENYQYTFSGNTLTTEQRRAYENNGFLLVKNLISKEHIDVYKEQFRKICDGEVHVPQMTIMKDVAISKTTERGEKVVTRIQDMHNDEVLFGYPRLNEIVQHVKDIIGPNIMVMHHMIVNKPPDPGTDTSRHPAHQDLLYFPFRPENRIVACWTAMEKIYEANGCLIAFPGTHKGQLLFHDYPQKDGPANKMYYGIEAIPSQKPVLLEMEEGDTVFFHPLLIHGSGPNNTQAFRKAISSHFAASECEYIDIRGTLQENLGKEMAEVTKKKLLGKNDDDEVDICEVWKFRARLVAGRKINI